MKTENTVMSSEEKICYKLKSLYRNYGYSRFKMSKFEEYDLYGQNKDFLISDSVITFTDTDGKLMALKPDVTLSIVKNFSEQSEGAERVFYNENVYRISDGTKRYKEIMQAGLECMGNLTDYNIYEVLYLAAKSLDEISENNVLIVSHLGLVDALLENTDCDRKELLKRISEKNIRGVEEICRQSGINDRDAEILRLITFPDSARDSCIDRIYEKTDNDKIKRSLDELRKAVIFCKDAGCGKIRTDFSLVSDMNYYNGIIFRGYVKEIPARVLSGGQYDNLMAKMGKKSKAVGFAVYLDLTERIKDENIPDTDILLIYKDTDDPERVLRAVNKFINSGKSVAAYTKSPEKLTYTKKITLSEAESL